MEITQTRTDQVQIAYQVVDDDGDYPYMNTVVYPAKEVPDDKAILAAIQADYAAWRKVMDTPAPEPTKADHEAELARAQRDKADAEARIVKATEAIAACASIAAIDEGDVKVNG